MFVSIREVVGPVSESLLTFAPEVQRLMRAKCKKFSLGTHFAFLPPLFVKSHEQNLNRTKILNKIFLDLMNAFLFDKISGFI